MASTLVLNLIRKITRGSTLDEVLGDVYRELRDLIPYDRISIVLLEPDGKTLCQVAVRSSRPLILAPGYVGPVHGSSLGEVILKGDAVILSDLKEHLERRPESEATRQLLKEGMRSTLALPLESGAQTIGALTFSSASPHAYAPEHADQVRELAGPIAIATEKARLIGELRQRNQELETAYEFKAQFAARLEEEVGRRTERERLLLRIASAVNASLDVEQVFRVAIREIAGALPFDRASITLVDETGTHVRFRALEPPEREILGRNDSIPLSSSSIGRVIREKRVIVAEDLEREHPYWDEELLFRAGIRSYVFSPLVLRGKAIGAFNLAFKRPQAVSPDDLELLAQVTEQMTIAVANARAYEEIQSLQEQLQRENITLKEELSTEHHFFEVVGTNPRLMKALRDAERVALTDATVLILGETGTGKELIARAIHRLSSRRDRAMVKVNCAALPESLIASELFGHEKGAFTGAIARQLGRFELARGGTLFLDEIGELPPEVQSKILRVLQDGEFERVGGQETLRTDARIIAATNRDLEDAVREGSFRQDLYYRLNVFPIDLPNLRERPEDIESLVRHFIAKFGQRFRKKITRIDQRSMQTLRSYRWPGNIRELQNVIERAVIVCDTDTLNVDPRWLQPPDAEHARDSFRDLQDLEGHLVSVERRWFEQVMAATRGRIYGPGGAAQMLGLRPSTLQSRLKRLGIR